MTRKLYQDAPLEHQFEATVVARVRRDDAPWVALDATQFYPLSGGQLADRGELGGIAVLDVVLDDQGTIWHRLAGELDQARVRGVVDAETRLDHTQQHTGQHLLSAALVDVFGAPTVSFHMGAEASTIDVDRFAAEPQSIARVEERCAELIAARREVHVHRVPSDQLHRFKLRKAPQVAGVVRLIEIAGFDVSPCGGTHVGNTAEIEAVRVLRDERIKQGLTRLTFLCGARVGRDHRRKIQLLDRLGALLSQPEDALAGRVAALLAQVKELGKQHEALQRELLIGLAASLAGAAEPCGQGARYVARSDAAWSASEIACLGRALVAQGVIALLGGGDEQAHLFFAAPSGVAPSMRELLEPALREVGGRGGGSASVAQGGGPRVAGLSAAIEAARARLVRTLAGNQT